MPSHRRYFRRQHAAVLEGNAERPERALPHQRPGRGQRVDREIHLPADHGAERRAAALEGHVHRVHLEPAQDH